MLENIFIKNCFKNPNKTAIICGNKKVSYSELINTIFLCAFQLKKRIKTNNKVMLKYKNSIEWIIFYFSIKFSNNVPVIVSNITPTHKIKKIILENKIQYIISSKKLNFRNSINLNLSKFLHIKKNFKKKFIKPNKKYDEILYTSGTTGIPKGVILTKQNSYFIAKMINKIVKLEKETVELISIPFSHSFGIGRLKCFAINGHTMVINDKPENLANIFVLLERHKVTGFSMVPSGIDILKKINFLSFSKTSKNLKFIELGSEKINGSSLDWLKRVFKKTAIYHHYGMTEASRSAFKIYRYQGKKLNFYKSSPGINISLINDKNQFCKKNEIGEIVIKGKSVSSGYVNKKIMKNKFSKFGFRSGDLGKRVSKNRFEIKGRIDNIKKINGITVDLEEVENCINDFPYIDKNHCHFIFDNVSRSYKIYSRYYSKRNFEHNRLTKFLSSRIESYKIPYKFQKVRTSKLISNKQKINLIYV